MPDPLHAEMIATQRARAAMPEDPTRALALARAAEDEFTSGLFTEERRALIVVALAALGRDTEAAASAHEFLERFPASPHARRVRDAIDGTKP
jgi:hypothetical protein